MRDATILLFPYFFSHFILTRVDNAWRGVAYRVCARIGFDEASENHNRTGNYHTEIPPFDV